MPLEMSDANDRRELIKENERLFKEGSIQVINALYSVYQNGEKHYFSNTTQKNLLAKGFEVIAEADPSKATQAVKHALNCYEARIHQTASRGEVRDRSSELSSLIRLYNSKEIKVSDKMLIYNFLVEKKLIENHYEIVITNQNLTEMSKAAESMALKIVNRSISQDFSWTWPDDTLSKLPPRDYLFSPKKVTPISTGETNLTENQIKCGQ